PSVRLLDPEVSRRSTQFEYSERKRGHTVFKVYADVSTETISGIHQLRDVDLVHYDEAGQPSATISGQEAVYRVKEKLVEFSGDVQIDLADGARIRSRRVNADLGQEIMTIEEKFGFERGKLRGEGNSLHYHIPRREIEVAGGVQMDFPSGSGDIRAKGRSAVYKLALQVIEFNGEAGMSGPESSLTSDQMTVFMNQDSMIQKILSTGHSQLHLSSTRTFAGQHINVFFDAGSEGLEYFEVLGEKSDKLTQRAFYSGQLKGSKYGVEADRIVGRPMAQRSAGQTGLERIIAQGDVRMDSPALGIRRSRAKRMEVLFFQDGQRFRQIDLQGEVEAVSQSDGSVEEILCTRLHVQLHPNQSFDNVKAFENVRVKVEESSKTRRLSAKDWVEVKYRNGVPDRILARGESKLEIDTPGERIVLKAPLIDVRYQAGVLDRLVGEGGAVLDFEEEGKMQRTASDRLEVFYKKGVMERAVQSGNFRFLQMDPMKVTLGSERAVFNPETQTVEVTGKESPVLKLGDSDRLSETLADQFDVNQETGHIRAFGNVRSLFHDNGNPIVITSGQMQVTPESGWINYSASPRMIHSSNSITGEIIRYNYQDQQLVAEKEVESIFNGTDEDNADRYRVTANRLLYQREKHRALYEGQVEVSMRDLVVEAPSVEFVFELENSEQLKEMVAWGGVRITGEAREAEGERAVHFPSQEKIVMTGDPARVFESGQGKASGHTLTFFTGDERLLVEGPERGNP
ncbi:MAG: LptA/OstA family protein, partial [Acidobacteriota bacterium]